MGSKLSRNKEWRKSSEEHGQVYHDQIESESINGDVKEQTETEFCLPQERHDEDELSSLEDEDDEYDSEAECLLEEAVMESHDVCEIDKDELLMCNEKELAFHEEENNESEDITNKNSKEM